MRLAVCIDKKEYYVDQFCKDVTQLVHHLANDPNVDYFGTIFISGSDARHEATRRDFTHMLKLPYQSFDLSILEKVEDLCSSKT